MVLEIINQGGDAPNIVPKLTRAHLLQPGFSTGWHRHTPTVFVVTRGTLTYYEEHAGECAVAGRFSAGQAYVHANRDTGVANERRFRKRPAWQ